VRDAHALGDGVGDVLTAHQQDSHEAGDPALVHDDVGDPRTDVDQRLDRGAHAEVVGLGHRAQHRERREVNLRRGQPRPLHRVDGRVDHVARRRHEQPAQDAGAALGGEVLQRVEVEHACSIGMGTKSCTWKGSAFFRSSAASTAGRPGVRRPSGSRRR
jgi:hypothetical protein